MQGNNDDLTPGEFPKDLNWTNEEASVSLEKLYYFVNYECDRAISWYYHKKNAKRIFGYLFRTGAIISLTVSGIIPILSEIFNARHGDYFSPAWSTVALAITALFITLDRLGGYTSGWIRYIRTGQILGTLQANFRIEWEAEKMMLQLPEPDNVAIEKAIQKCRDFLAKINNVVSTETDAWAEDFEKVLIEFERKIKEKNAS
jgi:hypothetical protein